MVKKKLLNKQPRDNEDELLEYVGFYLFFKIYIILVKTQFIRYTIN